MLDVFVAVLPVFLIVALGMSLDRLRVLPESFGAQLSQYVFKIAMPCLLFRLVALADIQFAAVGGYLAALFLAEMAVFAACMLLVRRQEGVTPESAIILALSAACSNSGFLGLPIMDSLLPGNRDALVAAGLSCIMPPLVMVTAQCLIAWKQAAGDAAGSTGGPGHIVVRSVLLNPFVVATVLGMMVSLGGVGLWQPADRVLELVGSTGAPCALVALGLDMWRKMEIARRKAEPHRFAWQAGIGLMKLLIHPALAWALLGLAGVQGTWLAVGVLMAGTSTAVMAYVLAEVTAVLPEESALSVVITAFLSMFSIPLFAMLLKMAGHV